MLSERLEAARREGEGLENLTFEDEVWDALEEQMREAPPLSTEEPR